MDFGKFAEDWKFRGGNKEVPYLTHDAPFWKWYGSTNSVIRLRRTLIE